MPLTKRISIHAPIDPEINIKVRDNLDYYITFPAGYDKSKSYGLVFCIAGYDDSADSDYQSKKLRPYIADKYNMITVGVRYHNDKRVISTETTFYSDSICNWYGVSCDYLKKVSSASEMLDKLFELLSSKNIFSLDSRLAVKQSAYHKYSSFGFMPAIDHLNVLFDIIKNYNIDKSRIIAFGSSYGGYIASLMAKYAPNTFSLVIDNSGFCVAQLQEIFGGLVGGVGGAFSRNIDNKRYEIPVCTDTLWSLDETSEYYFSDANKQIRNLLLEDHRTASSTVYCCYHSVDDNVSPINLKDKMYGLLNKYNVTYYRRITGKDIDGKLFKNTSHSMDASLRKMFDVSMEKYKEMNHKKEDSIDFDRNVVYGFPCSNKIYNFAYSGKGIDVSIESL